MNRKSPPNKKITKPQKSNNKKNSYQREMWKLFNQYSLPSLINLNNTTQQNSEPSSSTYSSNPLQNQPVNPKTDNITTSTTQQNQPYSSQPIFPNISHLQHQHPPQNFLPPRYISNFHSNNQPSQNISPEFVTRDPSQHLSEENDPIRSRHVQHVYHQNDQTLESPHNLPPFSHFSQYNPYKAEHVNEEDFIPGFMKWDEKDLYYSQSPTRNHPVDYEYVHPRGYSSPVVSNQFVRIPKESLFPTHSRNLEHSSLGRETYTFEDNNRTFDQNTITQSHATSKNETTFTQRKHPTEQYHKDVKGKANERRLSLNEEEENVGLKNKGVIKEEDDEMKSSRQDKSKSDRLPSILELIDFKNDKVNK